MTRGSTSHGFVKLWEFINAILSGCSPSVALLLARSLDQ